MSNPRSFRRDRLIIFGRYPVPGRTKTRLIPMLGPAGAADLQRRLTEKTLGTVWSIASHEAIGVEVCFEGGSESRMRRWLGAGAIFSPQRQGDLGERMHAAFLDAFQSGCRRVVLVGTDIPRLTTDHLRQAFDGLKAHDVVLGPSIDGGYWLIGLKRPTNLFHGIDWGKGTVLDQTVTQANRQGLGIKNLEVLTDIDAANDLKRQWPEESEQRPYISVIIPALNEAASIEATIKGAWDGDVEIIVVDGGSTDSTVERAIDAGARVESCPRGRAIQQNQGAEIARGRVLLFLHADTVLPGGFVGHVFETLMDPRAVAGAFRFKTSLDCPMMKVIELLINFRSQYLKMPYGDQSLFLRKSVFEAVGGFPDVPIAEDLSFVRRLAKRGRIRIAPANVITSERRWITLGLLRTTLINQAIVAGCLLGVSPHALASLYRFPQRK